MRILIATDAWRPQVNGVVRTYECLAAECEPLGASLDFLTPSDFRTLPCPTYPEIRLALPGHERCAAPHPCALAPTPSTSPPKGPWAGWCAPTAGVRPSRSRRASTRAFRSTCRRGSAFRASWIYAIAAALPQCGRRRHGGDREPLPRPRRAGLQAICCHGRAASTRRTSGRGRYGASATGRSSSTSGGWRSRRTSRPSWGSIFRAARWWSATDRCCRSSSGGIPDVLFTGDREGEELAQCYASADVFVFPSRTDTFGMVLLEAMASGLPIAALSGHRPDRSRSRRRLGRPFRGPRAKRRSRHSHLDRDRVESARAGFQLGARRRGCSSANVEAGAGRHTGHAASTARGRHQPRPLALTYHKSTCGPWRVGDARRYVRAGAERSAPRVQP